jgi:hypothetical protein
MDQLHSDNIVSIIDNADEYSIVALYNTSKQFKNVISASVQLE